MAWWANIAYFQMDMTAMGVFLDPALSRMHKRVVARAPSPFTLQRKKLPIGAKIFRFEAPPGRLQDYTPHGPSSRLR